MISGPTMLDTELVEALHKDTVPKFLATLDTTGKPNVVPITSLDAADDRTLIFGELFIRKTKANLESNPLVCVAVITEDLRVWTIRGRFRAFVESGSYIERMNQKPMFRYNAYVGVRRVVVIDVEEVTGAWKLSKPAVAAEILLAKVSSRLMVRREDETLPARVAQKFARTGAAKVIAYQGQEGYPEVAPLFSLVATRSRTMLFGMRRTPPCLCDLDFGTRVAASVITTDPIAYQVKGVFAGHRFTPAGRIGRLRVEEVYSACPPLAGERMKLQEPSK